MDEKSSYKEIEIDGVVYTAQVVFVSDSFGDQSDKEMTGSILPVTDIETGNLVNARVVYWG